MIISMLSAIGVVPTIAVLVAITTGVVLCTALLEQAGSTSRVVTRTRRSRRPAVQHVGDSSTGRPVATSGRSGQWLDSRSVDSSVTSGAELGTASAREDPPAPTTRSFRIVLTVEGPGDPVPGAQLGGLGADAELAGVLFAAYVDRGLAESSRVTGWVTASGSPTSVPSVRAGDRLRGRARRISELLACDDGDRNWVTLDAATDISLATERRPPTDPTLTGLLHWWTLATGDHSSLGPAEVRSLATGLREVLGSAAANPAAPILGEVCRVLDSASESGRGVRLEVRPEPAPGGALGAPAATAGMTPVS